MILTGDVGSVPTDGNTQDGENLSPTDIEANLSTEVALTVLDVLELFVHHHKVCFPLCCVDFFMLHGAVLHLCGESRHGVVAVGIEIKSVQGAQMEIRRALRF